MALNKREKLIAGTLGAVLVGVIANSLLIKPYFEARADLSDQIATMQQKNTRAETVLFERNRISSLWKQMMADGLKLNASDADTATVRAFSDWGASSRVAIESVKSDQAEQVGDFQQVRITATVLGNTAGLARWVWNLETSKLPLQLGDFRLNAQKDGVDDLSLQVTVTALAFVPQPPKTKGTAGQAGGK